MTRGPTPTHADETVSVVGVNRLAAGTIEVVLRTASQGRRRVLMPPGLATYDNVTITAAAIMALQVMADTVP